MVSPAKDVIVLSKRLKALSLQTYTGAATRFILGRGI
jgi:hypothetical protein